jgi:ribokinase
MLLVFGSINVDMLLEVESLPRPGETVLCPGFELAPGGKGANQAAAAARAGGTVAMAGRIGDDEFGRLARDALVTAGVDIAGILTAATRTGVAMIGIDAHGENQIIVASGANREVVADQVGDDLLRRASTILCQNEIPGEATAHMLARARAAGIRTVLNLAPASAVGDEVLRTVDVLVVNEIEARVAAGTAAAADPVVLAGELARRHGLACVVTLGGAGAVAMTAEGGHRIGTLAIDPVDTTGAGDAFTGVLAATLDVGLPLPQALRRASVAAGLTCLEVGAQSSQPSAAAIDRRLADLAEPQPLD